MTRTVKDDQLIFGQTPIDKIKFNPRSRDDVPQVLQGLQAYNICISPQRYARYYFRRLSV